jgi:HEAT repeat protein
MRKSSRWFGRLLCVGAAGIALGVIAARAASEADLNDFMAKIKSDQGSVRVEAILKAGTLGAEAVVPLGKTASGDNRDAAIAAQTALKHLAAYAGRPGAAAEKKSVAHYLTFLLDKDYSKVTRCLAAELLSWTGDDSVVPQVAALLADSDPDLRDEARRSLQAIPGPASLKALIDALGKAEGRQKLAIIASLGQRAAPEAADALVPLTGSSDIEVALEALDAVARIGIPKRDDVTLPSWDTLNEAQRMRLANSILRWADQRAAKGAVEDALEAYAAVAERAQSEHLICAALIGGAKAAPDQAAEHVVRALGHEANTVRATAARLLEQLPPDDAKATLLLEAYKTAKPESRDLILRVLKTWNDKKLAP